MSTVKQIKGDVDKLIGLTDEAASACVKYDHDPQVVDAYFWALSTGMQLIRERLGELPNLDRNGMTKPEDLPWNKLDRPNIPVKKKRVAYRVAKKVVRPKA